MLVDVGDPVRAGQTLALVESAAGSADLGRRQAAEARLRVAEATFERESKLAANGATPTITTPTNISLMPMPCTCSM